MLFSVETESLAVLSSSFQQWARFFIVAFLFELHFLFVEGGNDDLNSPLS